MKCKLTWLISLIQAAFSCNVGATKCTESGWFPLLPSKIILKSLFWKVQLPAEFSDTPLEWLDIEHTDDSIELIKQKRCLSIKSTILNYKTKNYLEKWNKVNK